MSDRELMGWIAMVAAVTAVVMVGWWVDWRAGVALAGLILWMDAR